jgi:hypothetical protein
MRGILVLILIVVVLAVVGWISFGRDGDSASINLETKEIKEDTQKALDTGAQLLKRAGEKIDNAVDAESEE